uniref:NADH dehydrogenase subunit 6 n=1 Tax=Seladonia aeraria TaxID=1310367 RepID=A0A7T9KR70_9HYME|nr:NADH dehydrogenase subunit 6 [Seladonia aeraria]QQS74778.1 NADH dehydrogenase subunit 6 [Seladonia aeraria]
MNSPYEFLIKFLFYLLMILITFIIFNKNISPLNMMMNLILFTLISLLLIYLITKKSMYCFMIFISIISGNMIMFLYFTSLINNYYNKSFKSNLKFLIILFLFSFIMIMYLFLFKNIINLNYSTHISLMIYKIYTYPLFIVTFILITYLLLTLLFSMKICLKKNLPLRKIKN